MLRTLMTGLSLIALSSVAEAQTPRNARRFLPELRADLTMQDHVNVAHVGGGFHLNSGTYMRLALLGGYGVASSDDESSASHRVEVQGRFHLDPTRASRFGLYGIGGIVANHDDFSDWQSKTVAGVGVELPSRGRGTLAIEVALAGGFRISAVVRRLAPGRR